jgi:hypothetical protein
MKARCCGCNHTIENIDKEYNTYWNFQLTCDKCGWKGYWDLIEDDGFVYKGMSEKKTNLEIAKLIDKPTPKAKCKCGSRIVCVDEHYICERYYEHIKQGIKQQQDIIQELQDVNSGI